MRPPTLPPPYHIPFKSKYSTLYKNLAWLFVICDFSLLLSRLPAFSTHIDVLLLSTLGEATKKEALVAPQTPSKKQNGWYCRADRKWRGKDTLYSLLHASKDAAVLLRQGGQDSNSKSCIGDAAYSLVFYLSGHSTRKEGEEVDQASQAATTHTQKAIDS